MSSKKTIQNAILSGNLSLVKSYIRDNIDIEKKDEYGRTILYDAIVKGYADIVVLLCKTKLNVNNQDKNGKTPLHFAAIYNQLDIAKILIQFGANVNLRDENGNTPLFDAIFNSRGNNDIILLLKKYNADYLTPNNHGISPKELAETIANFDVSHLFD